MNKKILVNPKQLLSDLNIKEEHRYKLYIDFDKERADFDLNYIGASDCGKLYSYDALLDLIFYRINRIDPFKDIDESIKIKMKMGKALEDMIADIILDQEQYNIKQVILNKKKDGSDLICFFYKDLSTHNVGATPDGFIVNSNNEYELLELKTSGSQSLKSEIKTYNDTGLMECTKTLYKYYCQVQLGMHLTGIKKARLFVFFLTGDFNMLEFEANLDWFREFLLRYSIFNRVLNYLEIKRKAYLADFIENIGFDYDPDDAFVSKEYIADFIKDDFKFESSLTLRDIKNITLEDLDIKKEDIIKYKEELENVNNKYQSQKDLMNKEYREGMKENNLLTTKIYNNVKNKLANGIYKVDNHIIIVNNNEHYINKRIKII